MVASVDSVRDLGLHLNSDMSMDAHVLLREALVMLVTSFIASKVDYCNVAFAKLARCELDCIQSVLNAAARLTAGARKFDHVTPLLENLHWLRVPERIQCKLCVLVHRCLNGAAPQYLT